MKTHAVYPTRYIWSITDSLTPASSLTVGGRGRGRGREGGHSEEDDSLGQWSWGHGGAVPGGRRRERGREEGRGAHSGGISTDQDP